MPPTKPRLRIITYMCPGHPVELYETYLKYLEDALGCESMLIYESRSSSQLKDRDDPFSADLVDLAFLSCSSYVKLEDSKNKYFELLPVTPIFHHPKNVDRLKGYYADIIIHADRKKTVKDFYDLRGCSWAYSNEDSLSGSTIILKKLKSLGENASFFGNKLKSGSHLASVQMVLSKKAEAACVDANTFACVKKYLQDQGKDIEVLESLGPLPPYPIVVNSRLPDAVKKQITEAFMMLNQKKDWLDDLKEYGLIGFTSNHKDAYLAERDIKEAAKGMTLGVRYY
ncbi:uncharacterized protein LOC124158530 [Ischnura elegans]|uniref:uncharacterized protein LOC124158530 n=1 Tax=Ischnura elegans TaxID=197161 RepID=UPI001ED8B7A7|nr:uncharacterized protein LOC124158530 [Ischnura elegans]